MAEAESAKIQSLSEQYLLEKEGKLVVTAKPAELEVNNTANATSEEAANPKTEENPIVGISEVNPASMESSGSGEQAESVDQEVEETSEILLETAPADFRFPTTNQSRHCFTRYIEYHRCVAAKGEAASKCDKFSKYYRSLCPGEWIDRWNEQRENGTFPGPL